MLKLLIHNVSSQIFGSLDIAVINKITTKLSYELPGAFFAQQFNPFAGVKYLFSKKTQSFPTGLVRYVEEILAQSNIPFEIVDCRKAPTQRKPLPLSGDQLRPYQEEAVSRAIERQRGIIKIGTGGGKTNVIAALTARLNVPTLILIHKKDVFYQIIDRLEKMLNVPIGKVGDGLCQPEKFTVGMIQTISRLYEPKRKRKKGESDKADDTILQTKGDIIRNLVEQSECIITDECHHTPADSFWDVHKHAENAFYKYGFSASPWRDDGDELLIEAAHASHIVDTPASWLIENGYLVPPKVYLLAFKHEKKTREEPYSEIYDTEVMNNFERNKAITQIALKAAAQDKTVLIAVTKIDHGRLLEAMLQQVEPDSLFVSGESDSDVRKQVLKDLNMRVRKIVICTTIFGEGVDVPNLDVLINAKAGASSVDAFQLIGRVLRKTDTKTKAYLVDIFDRGCKYIQKHSNARLKIYETEPKYQIQEIHSVDQISFDDKEW
jgi:superfamily II DNA or RNA helicase